MPLVNSIISWWMRKRIHQIELFMKYPHEVQQEVFQSLLFNARNTEWGKKYEYESIKNAETYRQRVPIQSYESLQPYIERQLSGEQNILWHSEVKWFAKSSGTTNSKSKFIPVTRESLEECHYKAGKDMLSIYFNNRPDSQLFAGKSLALGGSQQVNQFNNETLYGDLSAVLISNLPFWVEFYRTPDLSIALMDNWEEKVEEIARATMNENVTNISGVPTWTVVLAKKILEITGKNNLTEVWPNLELYIHGAVNFAPYRAQFAQLIPSSSMYYLETYNASEGFFGIQDTSESDMLLMLDYGIYYEFVEADQWGNDNAKVVDLSSVEIGKNYAILISTNGGLWRYAIGDTIKFTSINPYRIKITGRTKHFINAFGEELIIDNAEKAMVAACQATNATVSDYTAAPIYFSNDKKSGGHEWIIEFEQQPNDSQLFKTTLDEVLKQQNSDYEAKRKGDMALAFPTIHIAPKDTFYNWMKNRGKLGGQHKVPRLANERVYIEELLTML